ncbi:hypothetical protein E5E43_01900 [Helicobacter pylori]|nr:hypothetical protein E5E43_01900 [Helicobacter pylori]
MSIFLKHFCEENDTFSNAIFKMFDSACDGVSSIEACDRDGNKKKKN